MKFGIITPVEGLERFATLSDLQFALAHVDNERYWAFYAKRLGLGDTVILDNGAYEKGGAQLELLERRMTWFYMDADAKGTLVVVLPDFLFKSWYKTWHASIAFLDRWFDKFPGVQWMYVPQTTPKMESGWFKGLEAGLDDKRIGWIGLPRALCTHYAHPETRINVARFLKKEHPKLRVHALGLVNGNYHEIPFLSDAGVYSIDSNAPVWRGWNGLATTEKAPVPTDFDAPFDPLKLALINSNLAECGVKVVHP